MTTLGSSDKHIGQRVKAARPPLLGLISEKLQVAYYSHRLNVL